MDDDYYPDKGTGDTYDKDVDALVNDERGLQWLAYHLAQFGGADDAANETRELLHLIEQFKQNLAQRANRLRAVWENTEKWVSHDRGEDDVRRALERYRAGE